MHNARRAASRTARTFSTRKSLVLKMSPMLKKAKRDLERYLKGTRVIDVGFTDNSVVLTLEDDDQHTYQVWVLNDDDQPGRPMIFDGNSLDHLDCTAPLADD